VALVRSNRLEDAAPLLSSVGNTLADTPELAALRDRANLALGFAYLQANQPDKARAPLERVRLNGPYSNKALLGTGWAAAALGDYRGALTPWMELRGRDVLDSAVQESYLAVPYAFSQLNANAQSAEYYESAVNSFDTENGRLDAAIAHIQKGDMLREILAKEQQSAAGMLAPHGWFRDLKSLPPAPESPYLYVVLAGHEFQEGVKNYRDLIFMNSTLERWGDNMVAYQDMIDARERAYAEELPRADALLASGAVAKLQQRDEVLENWLRTIEQQHDVAALGTDDERALWARARRVESGLAALPEGAESTEAHARLALAKGVLYYQLDEAFGARLWQAHRRLKDLALALQEAQSRWIRVERARRNVPENTREFAARVAGLHERIAALQVRLAAAEDRQSTYLAQLAVHELEQQKDRLATYQVQARFALATMYDRAAAAQDAARTRAATPNKGAGTPQAPEPQAAPAPPPGAAPETQEPPTPPPATPEAPR
jgi:hypothetical protein